MIKKYKNLVPQIDKDAFVAENVTLVGDVKIESNANIWYGAVLRADADKIVVGKNTNIQDNSVVHVDYGNPAIIGNNITIGHGAIVHACTICDNCLIGMGAIILNGAKIGSGSIIGAGSLVTKNTVIPPNSMVIGVPAKVKRETTLEERNMISNSAKEYVNLSKEMMED